MDRADQRLDEMIRMAEKSGLSLDAIIRSIGRVDQMTFDAVAANVSLLPMYIQSSDRP